MTTSKQTQWFDSIIFMAKGTTQIYASEILMKINILWPFDKVMQILSVFSVSVFFKVQMLARLQPLHLTQLNHY